MINVSLCAYAWTSNPVLQAMFTSFGNTTNTIARFGFESFVASASGLLGTSLNRSFGGALPSGEALARVPVHTGRWTGLMTRHHGRDLLRGLGR